MRRQGTVTGTTIEVHPPTYSWATAAGAASSIIGLVILAVCITVSVSTRTAHGYEPMPAGTTALACVMTLGGLILLLFRILHGDREELDGRVDAIVARLEVIDEKLNHVWGIAARTSIEAKPARTEQHAPRRRKRNRTAGAQTDAPVDGAKVINLPRQPSQRYTEALKRIAKKIVDDPDK